MGLLFLTGFRAWDAVLVHRLIVLPQSRLTIQGSTNVSGFTCAIHRYTGRDTLVLHEGGKNIRPVFVKGTVALDAYAFDCGMDLMTSDFRKTIHADLHPQVTVDFISFERTPQYRSREERFTGVVRISLAGQSRLFEVDCSIYAQSDGTINLIGERMIRFSDFRLMPPERMLGAIHTREDMLVKFHLVLRLDPNG